MLERNSGLCGRERLVREASNIPRGRSWDAMMVDVAL